MEKTDAIFVMLLFTIHKYRNDLNFVGNYEQNMKNSEISRIFCYYC